MRTRAIYADIKSADIIVITFNRQEYAIAFYTEIICTQVAIRASDWRIETLTLNTNICCAEIQIITNHREILTQPAQVAEVGGAGISIITIYRSVRTDAFANTTVNRAGIIVAAIDLRITAYSIFTKILCAEVAIIAEDAISHANSV